MSAQWFVLESDGSGLAVATFEVKWYGSTEDRAAEEAEKQSKANPGVNYYVMRATQSFFSAVETVTKKRAL